MAEDFFSTSSNLNINNIEIDLSGAFDGQSLIFDGTTFLPADIVPVGSIEMWAGTTSVPSGWLLCNGDAISRSTYSRLFSVLSTTFGSGDGVNTFNIPNFDLKTPMGIQGGGTRGYSNITASSSSHSHNHTVSATIASDDQNISGNHYHSTTNGGDHNHNFGSSNMAHTHNTEAPSGNHTHSYNYNANAGANSTTGSTAHGTHNGISGVAATIANHTHTLSNAATGNHSHTIDAGVSSHTHSTWNGEGVTSNSGSSPHTHTVNTQRLYFIIKF
jgi:hypothetical protein